jgi:hypothetical protein
VTKSRSRVWKGVVRELEIRVFVLSCTGTVPEALLVSEDEKPLGVFLFFFVWKVHLLSPVLAWSRPLSMTVWPP